MDPRTQERVERWDSRQFTGGYDELSNLADDGFTGAVTAAGTWLFMLNGRIVGVFDGSLDSFEGASGTVYVAPDPSLPLLCSMNERGGETRAKYYTNDTPLTQVDRTLQEGTFTGYVELSENVLSGDYYAVYYGGRRMAAAYIGNAERLLTGDEAFERAADEVGIYEVVDVDVEVTDLPGQEPDPPATGGRTSDASAGTTAGGSAADTTSTSGTSATDATTTGGGIDDLRDGPLIPGASDDVTGGESDVVAEAEGESGDGPSQSGAADDPADRPATDPADRPAADPAGTGITDDPVDDSSLDPDELEAAAEELVQGGVPWADVDGDVGDDPDSEHLDEQFRQEERWRETRSIPSIDPDRTADAEADAAASQERETGTDAATADAGTTDRARSAGRSDDASADAPGTDERDDDLRAERDRLRAKNRELSSTVEQLRSRVEALESADVGAGGGAGGAGVQLSPSQALSETNLFVRYASKSRPTLAAVHEGGADREEVASNLRLEHHTGFDAAEASVAGEPYGEFLADSMEYRFVEWLTHTLPFEVRDTGNADALGGLYDVIPRIDRAELGATVSLADDDTADVPDQVTFDVVAFDKRGTPLIVATLNDSREPASEERLTELEAAASAVAANYPDLGAAIAVTSSYFDPGALAVAEEATSGGFLSRGSRLSYVNLTRKQGYHLCLVEARSGGFHVSVPEL